MQKGVGWERPQLSSTTKVSLLREVSGARMRQEKAVALAHFFLASPDGDGHLQEHVRGLVCTLDPEVGF